MIKIDSSYFVPPKGESKAESVEIQLKPLTWDGETLEDLMVTPKSLEEIKEVEEVSSIWNRVTKKLRW